MIDVANKAECTGCAACANACPLDCISMTLDTEGCEYPRVNGAACVECGRCERACPIITPVEQRELEQHAYLVQHKDPVVLSESTSGGAFTALAQLVIDRGGIVYGAGFVKDGESKYPRVHHFGVDSFSDLAAFRNSKYVQSEIGLVFREIKTKLRQNKEVLFSGTPCQVEGLLNYIGKDYQNLYTVDFVCHALPCRTVFDAYIDWLAEVYGKETSVVRFRDKRRYGYRYSNICAFEGNRQQPYYCAGVESDPFLRAFFSDIGDRPSCYKCHFKKRYRVSDMTLWDCFDVSKFSQDLNDNRGATRVLVHTLQGNSMIEAMRSYAVIKELPVEKAVEGVEEMIASVGMNPKRDDFLSDIATLSGYEVVEKWFPDSLWVKAERFARNVVARFEFYDQVKSIAKKVKGR